MNDNPNIQRIKGKKRQLDGELKEETGDKWGGAIDKVMGQAEEKVAELRINASRKKHQASQQTELKQAQDKIAQEEAWDNDTDL
jgi:uncharacterized protein YjbJ (UPF0337 family)